MPYEPAPLSASYRYADVLSVSGVLCDLDFGDPDSDPVEGVGVHGTVPAVGDRVLVLLQGRSATVVPAPASERYVLQGHARGHITSATIANATDVTMPLTGVTADEFAQLSGSKVKLMKSGYWVFGLSGNLSASAGSTRAFVTIVAEHPDSSATTRYWRQSFGEGESYIGVTGIQYLYSSGNPTIEFRCYQSTGSSKTFNGQFYAKWLGHDY